MLPNDCIAKLLDLEHIKVNNVEHSSNQIILKVQMVRRPCYCPACGATTDQVHDYRLQQV